MDWLQQKCRTYLGMRVEGGALALLVVSALLVFPFSFLLVLHWIGVPVQWQRKRAYLAAMLLWVLAAYA